MGVISELGELSSVTEDLVVFSFILVALVVVFLFVEGFNKVANVVRVKLKRIRTIALVLEDENSYRLIIHKYNKVVTIPKNTNELLIDRSIVNIKSDTNWQKIKVGEEAGVETEETRITGDVIKELGRGSYVIQDIEGNRISIHNMAKEIIVGDKVEVHIMQIEGIDNPLLLEYSIWK